MVELKYLLNQKLLAMLILAELPIEHELRNTPLGKIGAEYKNKSSPFWSKVTPAYGIAKTTYNQLGPVWKANDDWRVP